MIIETYNLTGSNTDILAAPSRLASLPFAGTLTMEFQSTVNDASNYYQISCKLPTGDLPFEDLIAPAGATAGGLNDDDEFFASFGVGKGGHVLVTATENGTGLLMCRFTLTPLQ